MSDFNPVKAQTEVLTGKRQWLHHARIMMNRLEEAAATAERDLTMMRSVHAAIKDDVDREQAKLDKLIHDMEHAT